MEKLSCPRDMQRKKKREMTSSTSKLYNPFKQSLYWFCCGGSAHVHSITVSNQPFVHDEAGHISPTA